MMNDKAEIIDEENDGGCPFLSEIRLCVLRKNKAAATGEDHPRREIAFAVGGDPEGAPVLLFPPLGPAGNRRMIASFQKEAVKYALKLICVNRPGTGSTTATSSDGARPQQHLERACRDIVDVLDTLGISEKVGLLFLCAGAPFALGFATLHPDRVAPGKIMGIAPFVSPADCNETKSLFQFGARHCPLWLVSPLVGGVFGSIASSIRIMPESRMLRGMQKQLSEDEREMFEKGFLNDNNGDGNDSFYEQFHWMLKEGRKGTSADAAVLLSPAREVGIDYAKLSERNNVRLYHGENDALTPLPAAQWLADQFGPPSTLQVLQKGTHEGSLFLLHPELEDGLKQLSSTTTTSPAATS